MCCQGGCSKLYTPAADVVDIWPCSIVGGDELSKIHAGIYFGQHFSWKNFGFQDLTFLQSMKISVVNFSSQ